MKIEGTEVEVEPFRNDWALALMSQGVIVKLKISWWRAKAPLKADEIGIKFNDKDAKNDNFNKRM